MPKLLSLSEIEDLAESLPHWNVLDQKLLTRDLKFDSYLAGVDALTQIAHEAESRNHHPEMNLGWRSLRIELSTHSEGGLTELDVDLAKWIEKTVSS